MAQQHRHPTIESWLADGIRRGHLTQQQATQLHGPLMQHQAQQLKRTYTNRLALTQHYHAVPTHAQSKAILFGQQLAASRPAKRPR